MFDRQNIRLWMAVGWAVSFVALWLIFAWINTPGTTMIAELNQLENNVKEENWTEADQHMKNLKKEWENQKFKVQVNNGTTNVSSFEQMLSQAESMIKNNEKGVVEHIGGLRQLTDDILTPFPGP